MTNITRIKISYEERPDFLPKQIGSKFLLFENAVYSFMDKFTEGYGGGFWQYYTLSNGGFYMVWDADKTVKVINDMNYFDDTMNVDSACIGVNLFALNYIMEQVRGSEQEKLINAYHYLKDFACEHEEAIKILGFID